MEQQPVENSQPITPDVVATVAALPVASKPKRGVSEKQREALARARAAKKDRVSSMAQKLAALEEENGRLKTQPAKSVKAPHITYKEPKIQEAPQDEGDYSYTYEDEELPAPIVVKKSKQKPPPKKEAAKPKKTAAAKVKKEVESPVGRTKIPPPSMGFFKNIF